MWDEVLLELDYLLWVIHHLRTHLNPALPIPQPTRYLATKRSAFQLYGFIFFLVVNEMEVTKVTAMITGTEPNRRH